MNVPLAPLDYEFPVGLEFDPELHLYLFDGEPVISVTQALSSTGLVDYSGLDPWYAERGTTVHKLCEELDIVGSDSYDGEFRVYLDRWVDYKRDSGIDIIGVEVPVFSPALRCAGTVDRVVYDTAGRCGIVDLKSGASHEMHPLQVAGYAGLLSACGVTVDYVGILELCPPNASSYRYKEWDCLSEKFAALSRWFVSVVDVARLLDGDMRP